MGNSAFMGNNELAGIYDVVIVGSGPAGFTAGIYAGRAGASVAVIAGEMEYGGALINTSLVENYPGFEDGIMGPELMNAMQMQCEKFVNDIVLEDALEISDLDSEFSSLKKVVASDGKRYLGRSIILATGSEHRKLNVPGEKEFGSGGGVSYCATCDAAFFKGQRVFVIGGGDTAMEEASTLARFAKEVTIIHRRKEFKASKAMVEKVESIDNVNFVYDSVVERIVGADGKMAGVEIRNVLTNETFLEDGNGLFVAIGSDPRTELFKDVIDTNDDGYVIVDEPSTRTNILGVFACGDLVDYTYQQAITAAGSGCKAGLDAVEYVISENGSLTRETK